MAERTSFYYREQDADLKEFMISKGGLKQGVKFLYDFYINNQNLAETIVSRLREEMPPTPSANTTIKPIRLSEMTKKIDYVQDDEALALMANFIK